MSVTTVVPLSGDPKISVSEGGDFQVQNSNTFSSVVVGGNKPVRSGKRYFEVRCVDKCPLIGWAVARYKKSLTSGDAYEVFYGDIAKEQICDGRNRTRTERTHFNSGDIIGCLLDIDEGCVSFSHNGVFLSSSLTGLRLHNSGGYIPVIEVKARSSIFVSYTLSSFCVELPEGAFAYDHVDEAPLQNNRVENGVLSKVFDDFVTGGSGDKCEGDELQNLFTAIGSTSDLDPIVFVFMFYLDKTLHVWEVQRDTFVRVFQQAGCSSLADISRVLKKEEKKLENRKTDHWKEYYIYVFHLLKAGSTMLNAETAAEVWRMFGFGKWKFYDKWANFILEKQKEKEAQVARRASTGKQVPPELIGYDVWDSFPEFMESFPSSFDGYDSLDLGYNSLFDDFVESLQS